MKRETLLLLILLVTGITMCAAQEKTTGSIQYENLPEWPDNNRLRTHSTMFGIGYRHSLDTYLSPESYTGTEARLIRENMRMTRLLGGRISVQNLMQGNFSYTHSRSEDGKELSGLFDWNTTWHYNLQFCPALRLLFGAGLGFHGGFVYNMRNGNNPAQARLSSDLNLSGAAIYKLHFLNRTVTLRYQGEIPMLGLMFSPNYGQSYYEIFSLGHYDHNVCVTHPFQAFTFNQLLTADFPFHSAGTLRIGYMGAIRQYRVNNLKMHDWSHLFLVGYVKHFYLIKGKSSPNQTR